ncbi:MAG TPA: hypothetical protein DCY12_06530 [Candidatus Atribacteria bacterium]|nr:hypothetical protein [Candidatus Atribacteria bacterium]
MNKKLWHLIVVLVFGTVFSLFFSGMNTTRSEETKKENAKEMPLLLSIASKFKATERPPVQFFHDRHANALVQEGCPACHSTDKNGNMSYTFPKNKNDKSKNTLMNSYHKACIGCHKEISQTGKSSGPVTCGECHMVKNREIKEKAWPDAGFNYYSHNLHVEVCNRDCVNCHHTGDNSSCRDCHGLTNNGIPSYKNAAHSSCIKCHLGSAAGPSSCGGCHSGIKSSLEELAAVPRLNIGQPEKALVRLNSAKMPGVPFNHKEHEGYTTSCRACHHKTMQNCNTCHTLKENPEGGNIALALAYHKTPSERSCVGCHESKKIVSQCNGCHQARKNGLTETSCFACHRLSEDKTFWQSMLGDPANLLPKNLPEILEINTIENKYLPVKFSHFNHIKKLTEVSEKNKLSNYFHCNQMTICMGCHHHSELYPAKAVPPCNTCHRINAQENENPPALQGAYHRQCIACHKEMKVGPTDCNNGCHLPKKSEVAGGMITPHTN